MLVSKQEKRLVLELKYNIVYITYDENTETFKFLFLDYNDLFDIDFSFFMKQLNLISVKLLNLQLKKYNDIK